MMGPLFVAAVLYYKGSYQESFALLLSPVCLTIIILMLSFKLYPNPQHLEIYMKTLEHRGMTISFWVYLMGAGLIAAGYADFSLMAYHFEKHEIFSPAWVPVFYSLAMGVASLCAPLLGHLYDRKGMGILIWATLLSLFFSPFVFLGNFYFSIVGIVLWSIGIGAHESLMRAIIAHMIEPRQRASAYGIFSAGFGTFWFIGSITLGFLYDFSIWAVIIFSLIIQFLALPLLMWVNARV